MRILAIETSCDDTGVAIIEPDGKNRPKLLANFLSSQVKIHAPYGGVVPSLAKREHQKNLVPILKQGLGGTNLLQKIRNPKHEIRNNIKIQNTKLKTLKEILSREPALLKKLLPFLKKYQKPDIDIIAVTNGPGLEPALWVGVNFARALGYFWSLPVIPINHIEAHIIANWLPIAKRHAPSATQFPAICLVVSGGHTQLVLMRNFGQYKIMGETRDDAAGEAFDKLARMLNLSYPGGPIVAHIATKFKSKIPPNLPLKREVSPSFLKEGRGGFNIKLPRPMINSPDYDFSFSGLKTAALYFVKTLDKKTLKKLTPEICAEFQQAVADVLIAKTIRAAKELKAKTIMLSGGVAANDLLRNSLSLATNHLPLTFSVPPKEYCTDNAAMIALTAALRFKIYDLRFKNKYNWQKIKVDANLRLA